MPKDPWSGSELKALKHLKLTAGKTLQEIADIVGRTRAAVAGQSHRMGYSRPWKLQCTWNNIKAAVQGLPLPDQPERKITRQRAP